jgi:hypothetical protein
MGTEIEKFDPSKLMDGVKERIRATFVSLIPDAAWDQMVKGVVDEFMTDRRSWSDSHQPSPFKTEILRLLKEEVGKRVQAYFSTPEWENQWRTDGVGGQIAGSKVREIIKENMGDIVTGMLANAAGTFIQNLKYQISQAMQGVR